VFHSEGFYLDAVVLCSKGQEKFEGIAVGFDGIGTHSLDVKEVLIEKLMHTGRELHCVVLCQREKSRSFLRLWASATLR
jgi:hypothetical protein